MTASDNKDLKHLEGQDTQHRKYISIQDFNRSYKPVQFHNMPQSCYYCDIYNLLLHTAKIDRILWSDWMASICTIYQYNVIYSHNILRFL